MPTLSPLDILVIGRHAELLQTVLRLIHTHPGWRGAGVAEPAQALTALAGRRFDVLLITNGLAEQEDAELQREARALQPELLVIQHYGGGSGLLENEILEALYRAGRLTV